MLLEPGHGEVDQRLRVHKDAAPVADESAPGAVVLTLECASDLLEVGLVEDGFAKARPPSDTVHLKCRAATQLLLVRPERAALRQVERGVAAVSDPEDQDQCAQRPLGCLYRASNSLIATSTGYLPCSSGPCSARRHPQWWTRVVRATNRCPMLSTATPNPSDRAHPEQNAVGRLAKHHFVDCFVPLGAEHGVTDVALHPLTRRSDELALAARRDADQTQRVRGQPRQLAAGIDQRLDCGRHAPLFPGVDRDDVDAEHRHATTVTAARRACRLPEFVHSSRTEMHPAVRRISATEASGSFSKLLDAVERGHRFLVQRRGEDICVMAAPTMTGRRASACVHALRGRSPVVLDGSFGDDLLDKKREVGAGDPGRPGARRCPAQHELRLTHYRSTY